MKKKILPLLLVLCMMLSLIPSVSAAQSGTCGEGLTWSFADGTLTISGNGAMEDYYEMGEDIHLAPWTDFAGEIKNLVIGSGVTYIGTMAFYRTGLTTVDLSATNVTGIGAEAFSNSTLTSIVLPKGLTDITPRLFLSCSKLTSVGIPATVQNIGAESFMLCSKLDILTIPAGVTAIASSAFRYGPNELFFEGDVPQIASDAFHTGTTYVYYPQGNTTWNDSAFSASWASRAEFIPYVPFTDVPSDAWFKTAVTWAVQGGITQGTDAGKFSPDANCTRAQVVTFLWRSFGEPQPQSTTNPFTDVKESDYYYNAVLWAVENNITVGTGEGTFSPEDTCTRAQVATFLWRTNGQPQPESSGSSFTDVSATEYYYTPILWAVEEGITVGTSPSAFSPDATCTRAQIVTFLYRAPRF